MRIRREVTVTGARIALAAITGAFVLAAPKTLVVQPVLRRRVKDARVNPFPPQPVASPGHAPGSQVRLSSNQNRQISGAIEAIGKQARYTPACSADNSRTPDPAEGKRWFCNEARLAASGWAKAAKVIVSQRLSLIAALVGGAAVLAATACASPGSSTVAPSPTPCVWDSSGTWSAKADGGFLATQPDFEISLDLPLADGSLTGRFALPGGVPSSNAAGSTNGKTIELHTTEATPIGFTVTVAPDGKTASGKTTDNANVTLTLFSRAPQCQ